MSKIALMTGVTGYLGSQLAKALLAQGYKVIGLKREGSSLRKVEALLPDLLLYDLDGLDFTVPFMAHGKVDVVIHSATCYGRNGESVSQIAETNTVFPLRVLEAAINAGTLAFFNTDTSLDKSLNAYALSKEQFAEWGHYFANAGKIRFVNARLEHFYGPGDDDSKFTSHVVKSCMMNVPDLALTPGEQMRDFVYIDDVVSAYLVLVENMNRFSEMFMEFDVGSGAPVSIRDFVETAHRITGSKTRLNFGALPYREGEVMQSRANIRPLQKLGWSPRVGLEQGISQTMKGHGP